MGRELRFLSDDSVTALLQETGYFEPVEGRKALAVLCSRGELIVMPTWDSLPLSHCDPDLVCRVALRITHLRMLFDR